MRHHSPTSYLLMWAVWACMACNDPSASPPVEAGSGTTEAVEATTHGGSTSGLGPGPGTTAAVDDTSEDEGVVFLVMPDGGSHCSIPGDEPWYCYPCDVVDQDCAADYKCMPWASDGGPTWNDTRCSPLPEHPVGVGKTCTVEGSPTSGLDDCAQGSMCWGVDPRTLLGTCKALCDAGQPDDCGASAQCAAFDGPGASFYPAVCLRTCDPLDPASCGTGDVCREVGGAALCLPPVVLPDGLPCGDADEHCAADHACLYDHQLAACGESACCAELCDLSASDPDLPCTQPGELCRPLYASGAPVGLEHVGACALPL